MQSMPVTGRFLRLRFLCRRSSMRSGKNSYQYLMAALKDSSKASFAPLLSSRPGARA